MAKDHNNPEDPFFDQHPEHKPEISEEKHEFQKGRGEEDKSSGESLGSGEHDGETSDPQEEQNDATNEASEDHIDQTFEEATAAPESNTASEEKIEYVQYVGEHEEDAYSSPDYGDVQPDASLDYGYTAALRKLYADPEYLRKIAEWEAAQNAPLPMPPDNFPDDPADSTLITQGDTQTTAEATHPESVNSYTQTAQHDEHGEHQAKPGEPKAAPELNAVGAGNTTLTEGHQGEAVGEIQRLLGLEADGIFSADLAAQIAKFQEDEGINPTGIVDQVTLQALQAAEYDRLHPKKMLLSHGKVSLQAEQNIHSTPVASESSSEEPTEQLAEPPTDENQDNLLQQAARIINEGELGLLEGYTTSTIAPLYPESARAFERLHNNIPFNTGKALGDALAGAQAVLGMAAGLIDMMGGGGEAAIASPTVVGVIPGMAAVAVGAGMVAQGFGAFGRASSNLGNDLQNLFNPMDGGGQGAMPTKAKKVKTKNLPEPPEGHEWYQAKDGSIETRVKAPEGHEWYMDKEGEIDIRPDAPEGYEWFTPENGAMTVRRKAGNAKSAMHGELQYNSETGTFEPKDRSSDFIPIYLEENVPMEVPDKAAFKGDLDIRAEWQYERDKAIKRGDELARKEADVKIQQASERIGERATDQYVHKHYPGYEPVELAGNKGRDRFDKVYRNPDPPPKYVIAEAKGGDGRPGSRLVPETLKLAEQGTPEYIRSMIKTMEKKGDPLARELKKALNTGQVEYINVQAPIKNSNGKVSIGTLTKAPELELQPLKVSKFDTTKSFAVTKPGKSQ